MDECESSTAIAPDSNASPAARRSPVGLIIALVLTMMAAGTAGLYAQWLVRQRDFVQARLALTERKLLDLREQLTRAEVTVQEQQAALDTRDAALAAATQPDLPVRVSFRPAWMGQGMVATLRNVSPRSISLRVEVRDPNVHKSKSFAFDIDPGASADIGHAQGWLVTSGQSLRVAATGYKTVTAFAP